VLSLAEAALTTAPRCSVRCVPSNRGCASAPRRSPCARRSGGRARWRGSDRQRIAYSALALGKI